MPYSLYETVREWFLFIFLSKIYGSVKNLHLVYSLLWNIMVIHWQGRKVDLNFHEILGWDLSGSATRESYVYGFSWCYGVCRK